MKKPKYSGKLARPITPGLIELTQYGSFDDWLKSDHPRREFINRMYVLLEHYKIDASQENCWFFLAWDLASDHVKGFTIAPTYKGPGRPKKIKPPPQQPKKRRGRPEINTLEDAKELVRIVEGKKLELQRERKRRITDRETLTVLITHYSKSIGRRVRATLFTELSRYQKLLSESRKKIRENNK